MTAGPSLSPAKIQQWLIRIDSAQRSGGRASAASLALQAVSEGVVEPSVLNLAASARYGEGQFAQALALLERARAIAPDDPNVLNSLGICFKALGRLGDALDAYGAAARAEPNLAAPHFNRGSLLEQMSDLHGAREAYERASALDPGYVEPIASLAWMSAVAGDGVSARTLGEKALALSPGNMLARLALASADLQMGDLARASARLFALGKEPGITPTNRSIALSLLGDLLDAEDRPAEAFAAYQAANSGLKALNAARFEGSGGLSALDHANRLIEWFTDADAQPWTTAPAIAPDKSKPAAHVFLVGFPRSGTTLLENVLATHPDVVSLEEKDGLEAASSEFLTSPEGLSRLANLDAADAKGHRDHYWAMVRDYGVEAAGRVFIDKMPLSSIALPVIAKLFPNARIMFARRDPRDVVLSCFRRRFGMNPSMYQLLTLDGAAAYYDAVMRLSDLYRAVLPLPQHIVRYESLVDDFESTAKAACDFLGLEWNADMLDFAVRARSRGISTPSAAQVARGLNRDGQGVWRRYERQMAPLLPVLEPWVQRFGYEA